MRRHKYMEDTIWMKLMTHLYVNNYNREGTLESFGYVNNYNTDT